MEATITRRKSKKDNYSIIDNSIFKSNLSSLAKYLLIAFLSLPSDWEFHKQELHKRFAPDTGVYLYNKTWSELLQAGYLEHEVVKNPENNRIIKHKWYVNEEPKLPSTVAPKKTSKNVSIVAISQSVEDSLPTKHSYLTKYSKEQQQSKKAKPISQKTKPAVVVVSLDEERKRRILDPYPLKESTIKQILEHPIEQIERSVYAFEQYKQNHYLSNPLGCLRKAIIEGWIHSETKGDIQKKEDEKKQEQEKVRNTSYSIGKELEKKYEHLFTRDIYFNVCDTCVYLRTKNGTYVLELIDPDVLTDLERYIKTYLNEPKLEKNSTNAP